MKTKEKFEGYEVSNRVELLDIKIIKSSYGQQPNAHSGKKNIDMTREVDVQVDEDNKLIFVVIDFELEALLDKSETPVVKVESKFLLVYSISDCSNLSEKAYQQFAEVNAVFNAWPYWREFVQNATLRMGLPPLTMPVFKIVQESEEDVGKKEIASEKIEAVARKNTSKKKKTKRKTVKQ